MWDAASLLNHDGAGFDDPDSRDYAFIKRQTYDETSAAELAALDELGSLLAAGRVDELADFYQATPALRLEGAERDRHSLVFRGGAGRRREESGAAIGPEFKRHSEHSRKQRLSSAVTRVGSCVRRYYN